MFGEPSIAGGVASALGVLAPSTSTTRRFSRQTKSTTYGPIGC
jgi:hypothetical protein